MKRVLLLGGTGDALTIARRLGPDHVYSLAGLGRIPGDLFCSVRVGGFGGIDGLKAFIEAQSISLIVDATHPYAAQMSRHASAVSALKSMPCWALRRAPWQPQSGDAWREAADFSSILDAIAPYHHPLWTLGREPLSHLDEIAPSQHWTIRCLDSHPGNARATIIAARGPFSLDGERALFDAQQTDVLISKNSGGAATEAKLAVARERGLPVVMLQRPGLPPVEREFSDTSSLLNALEAWLHPHPLFDKTP
ncbi:cobalt-precorrin-6A reductase [Caballeronia sordidicola]|uniref:cobalt-precorrin-6A reductase n=1 Tax=Caballeronia sordidicola TaxID=196367 RepID=UPI0004D00B3D|nr:cobalt-precorrin-6A reductase [Caballeronia sordidicola]